QGRVCEQRAAGRKGAHHHRGHGSSDPHAGPGARSAEASLALFEIPAVSELPAAPALPAARALPAYRVSIQPDWIDFNGHLRDAYYVLALSFALNGILEVLGSAGANPGATLCLF